MTMTNDAKQNLAGPVPAWRRWANNVAASLALLAQPPRIRPTKRWLWPARHLGISVVVAAAMFLATLYWLDAALSGGARTLPAGVIHFFEAITDYGKSGWVLWPLGILFLLLAALPPVLPRAGQLVVAAVMVRVGFLFLAIGVPGLIVSIIKRLIGRARPFVTDLADPFVFEILSWRASYASLPSGHSTTAFGILAAFGLLWPRARPALLIYALLIAVSRIVVTAHYPTDVAAGAVCGIVGALMVRRYLALRRLGFSIGPDGVTRRLPGPSWRRIKSVAQAFLKP